MEGGFLAIREARTHCQNSTGSFHSLVRATFHFFYIFIKKTKLNLIKLDNNKKKAVKDNKAYG